MDGRQDHSIRRFPSRAPGHGERPLTADQHLTRRLAAILAADVVGYTRLMGEDESGTLLHLNLVWGEVFNPAVARYHGRIVKTMGDGALVEFGSAVDAVTCAVAIQSAMADRNASTQEGRIEFRIGVNLGEIVIEGADIFGDGVNVAARLEGHAPRGGILISDLVNAQVKGKIDATFVDAGEVSLKNVDQPLRVWRWGEVEATAAPAPAFESSNPSAPISVAVRAAEGFWVAVLPFKSSGSNADLTALAEALCEEIVTGLSRFSYLRVIARSSTLRYAGEAVDVRAAGKALGARYVMEGSLRQAGTKLRIAVQLIDATTGAHLWAENYERSFSPEAVFELQDELVPRIVSTVADSNGVLPRSTSEALRGRAPEQLSPYEAVLRSFGYFERITAEELAAARSGLELAVRTTPGYADAWAMLALLCVQEHAQGFNLQADSLANGLNAARRAVEAAPSNHLAHFSLAQALFFHKEFQSFRNAAERAVALNPMDGNSIAFLGELLTYAGDWERGLALAGRAKQLNPSHPGWYWYAEFYDGYRRGDYRGALAVALKVNLPGQWFSHAAIAAACGQLGEREAAGKALRDLLRLRPNFAGTVRTDIEKWWKPEYVERLIDGWRKAGLEIAPANATVTPP
jgi:adenylate cyclase